MIWLIWDTQRQTGLKSCAVLRPDISNDQSFILWDHIFFMTRLFEQWLNISQSTIKCKKKPYRQYSSVKESFHDRSPTRDIDPSPIFFKFGVWVVFIWKTLHANFFCPMSNTSWDIYTQSLAKKGYLSYFDVKFKNLPINSKAWFWWL